MSLVQRMRSSLLRRSSRLSCAMATRNGRISMVEPPVSDLRSAGTPDDAGLAAGRESANPAKLRQYQDNALSTARVSRRGAERGPVSGRGGPGHPPEVLAQGGGRGEPAPAGHLLDRQPGGLEQLLGAQHALVGQPGQRGGPGDLAEPPVEIAPAHPGPAGEDSARKGN